MSDFENRQIRNMDKPESEFTDKVVEIKRVSKKTKGGNQISFTALVVAFNLEGECAKSLNKVKDAFSITFCKRFPAPVNV